MVGSNRDDGLCKMISSTNGYGMQAHERHFLITTIYKMHPSPPAFPKLLAMVTVEFYIVG
jgi:hypothetical protein